MSLLASRRSRFDGTDLGTASSEADDSYSDSDSDDMSESTAEEVARCAQMMHAHALTQRPHTRTRCRRDSCFWAKEDTNGSSVSRCPRVCSTPCGICHKPLGGGGSLASKKAALARARVCNNCNQLFHRECCR